MIVMLILMCIAGSAFAGEVTDKAEPIVGMYIHQHWPFNRPYAARTWTLEDWRGYMQGLKALGYNTVQIWPVLETMPQPLTDSDRANLEKIAAVVDIAHALDMRVYIMICANIIANDAVAAQSTFQQRHFFHCDMRVNPADKRAVARMMARRKGLFGPLSGLLFGEPDRFITDLVLQLRFKAAYQRLCSAVNNAAELKKPFGDFLVALENWQNRHGYENYWGFKTWGSWGELMKALDTIDDPRVNAVLDFDVQAKTPYGRVKEEFYRFETFTPQLIKAMRAAWQDM